jgi:hypothetical protein
MKHTKCGMGKIQSTFNVKLDGIFYIVHILSLIEHTILKPTKCTLITVVYVLYITISVD